jgi:hypothetical protein
MRVAKNERRWCGKGSAGKPRLCCRAGRYVLLLQYFMPAAPAVSVEYHEQAVRPPRGWIDAGLGAIALLSAIDSTCFQTDLPDVTNLCACTLRHQLQNAHDKCMISSHGG